MRKRNDPFDPVLDGFPRYEIEGLLWSQSEGIVRVLFLVVFSICIWTSSAAAQRDETFGVRVRTDSVIVANHQSGGVRVFTAFGGGFIGTLVGGYVGYHVLPHNCSCDDPGLDEMIYGAFAGMVIGAALGASGPDLGSVCSFDKRLMRSLAGAGLAGVAGYVLAGGHGNGGTVIAVPAGAVGGSLAALGRCWKSG
jgi:hypothetical protein